MIEPIHKQAILKLINCMTTAPLLDTAKPNYGTSGTGGGGDHETPLYQFRDQMHSIDLPALSRLGLIISKFERVFRPHPLIVNGSHLVNLKSPFNSANILYLQQISGLVNYIEETDLFGNRNENNNGMETLAVLQASQHLHALVMLIRDWLLQFYHEKSVVYSLFPTINNPESVTFNLVEIKENNICLSFILIFNIIYKLRDSFPEYTNLLDFSWLLFASMERFLEMVKLDFDYVGSLLQTSLLYSRMEDEQERVINTDLYKQIDTLRSKIVETKKRIQTLATNKGQLLLNKPTTASLTTTSNDQHLRIGNASQARTSMPPPATVPNARSSRANSGYQIFSSSSSVPITDKPFKCLVCTKNFPTSYKLNRHTFSHSGERPYLCAWPNCLKRFNDNYHLRRHMNTHTGDKPFPCKYPGCSKRYSRSEDLRNHQKTHYGSVGGVGEGNSGGITAITTNNGSNVSGVAGHQPTIHLTNSDGTTLNVLVQSNSLNSPVSYSLAHSTSASISPLSGNKTASLRLTADPNAGHPDQQAQLVLQSQLNQLQLQLHQQSQAQVSQQQQQQQQQQAFAATLSPGAVGLGNESALQPTIILQEAPSSVGGQNHGAASLHINDYTF